MADNEKNMPTQEPENQENEIKDLQLDSVNEIPENNGEPLSEENVDAVEETVGGDDTAPAEETEQTPDVAQTEEPVAEEEIATQAEEEPAVEAEQPASEASEEISEEQPEMSEEVVEESAEEAIADEPADEPIEESSEEPEAEIAENPVAEADESAHEAEDEPAVEAEESAEESAEETEEQPENEAEPEDEKFEIAVGEDGELQLKNPVPEEEETSDEAEEQEPDEEEFVDPEDLVIHDEVVAAIKAEGERLENNELSLKAYLKHSKEAIKNFESALATGQKALETNRDEKEAPVILAGIIKICGKLLEIKSNNLENIVRVKAYNYIKELRTALHLEIDRYNDFVITYASVTGEQLTRLSTFLPENIASGKSLAVVPELSYKESYVQVLPDEEKGREDSVTTMVITPAVTAEIMLHDVKTPRTKFACSSYAKRVKSANARLNEECARLNKLLQQTKTSRKRYESELASLEKRTPLADRAKEEYKNKVFAINIKYGRELAGINTIKTRSAFARTRLRLLINRFAVEREKLVLAYEYVRAVYRAGSYSQRKAAEKFFAKAIVAYNKCAERCTKATGTRFDQLPPAIIERACRGTEPIQFPTVAYKRELVEKVGESVRPISMAVAAEVTPNDEIYSENSAKILDSHSTIKDTASLSNESAIVDRASAIAKVMLESLKESADLVLTTDEFEQFDIKSQKAIKYFKRALKQTEKAISRAFDEHGVVTALVENLRVIANLIEVRRLCITVCMRLKREDLARAHGRALYRNIELYNGRAIDYMSIVGEQFSRITTATSKELMGSADKIKVPVITYKDNYIEVFPKDPLKDSTYEKPRLWRAGIYTPLLMQHYRLTENRAVETTVINSPFVFDVMTDDMPAASWWHPIGFMQHLMIWTQPIVAWWHRVCTNIEIWFVDESLLFSKSGLAGRQNRNDKKKAKYERKLKKLNAEHSAKILALETVVHETDRHSASYQKQLYNINAKFSRKVYNLKVRWMRDCTGRNAARLLLERLVLERERLAGINKVLIKYRSYGRITFTRNILTKYKKRFIDAINAHNATAKKLSEMVGVNFAEVSTSVADEIIRYGKMIKFPEIVCCREVIETVDGQPRTVGDKWHGYGLYTGASGTDAVKGNSPIMSVGAMGYATDMGVPFLKADFNGMTILGMTPGGVPLIGFTQTGETSIPFTGTPMMLSGTDGGIVLDAGMHGQDSLILGAANVTDPYSGISKRGVDENFTDDYEEDSKDMRSGCEVETPLDIEAKLIEERFTRALRARAMTSVDNLANWWKLIGSEINVWFMRKLILNPRGFLRYLTPPKDPFIEIVNTKVSKQDTELLQQIAKVGGVIDIECKRLYSATKTGIRRSQRVWSGWLHEDIELYNKLVKDYNSGRERYMHLETLSLNIPDTIIFRKTDRPPAPPILSLRNRVKIDESRPSITTDEIYDKLIDYAKAGALRYASPFERLWAKLFTIPGLTRRQQKGKRGSALPTVAGLINKRSARTYARRQDNEYRHYRIRYEKARAMKRYNRRTLRAVGVANDPIKYQARVHKVLRDYLATNFRIDYNMRIRQLIYRAMRVDVTIYWIVTLAIATVIALAAIFLPSDPALQVLVMIGIVWAALPILFVLLRIVYDIVMFIASCLLLITRNIWLIKYGARDIERNRYGAILDCFVTEQYRLLLACERLREKPRSGNARKALIATVNDYNKRAEVYSEILRVPIKAVELTDLIDKLCSGETHHLPELQNFVYVRELVERVDKHQRGKTLKDRELTELVAEINQIINSINLAGSDNQIAVDFLQAAMQRLISYLQTGIKPTQNQRFELKRDLIQGISQFDIGEEKKEIFSRDVIKVVDQIGGRDSRKIISILAEDNMIL